MTDCRKGFGFLKKDRLLSELTSGNNIIGVEEIAERMEEQKGRGYDI